MYQYGSWTLFFVFVVNQGDGQTNSCINSWSHTCRVGGIRYFSSLPGTYVLTIYVCNSHNLLNIIIEFNWI